MSPKEFLKIAKTSDKILLNNFLSRAQPSNKVIAFKPTKSISTYLYCIIAGKYFVYDVPKAQLYKVNFLLFRIFRWNIIPYNHTNKGSLSKQILSQKLQHFLFRLLKPILMFLTHSQSMIQPFAMNISQEPWKILD